MTERGSSLAAIAASVPWCCLLPAIFALLGLAGAGAARTTSVELMPFLLGASLLFLGRAHYLIHVRRQGTPWARWTVWLATALAVGLWVLRLL